MANRERPQPFRFWLPFYSRHAPTLPPPPSTRRQARSPTPPASPRASPVLGTQPRHSSQGQSATPPTSSLASPSASPVVEAQPQYSPTEPSSTPPPAPSASPAEAAAQPQYSPQAQQPTPASPLGSSSTSPEVAAQPQHSSQEQALSQPTSSLVSPSASPKVGAQPPYSSQAQPPIPPPSQAQPPIPPPSQPASPVVIAQSLAQPDADLANSEGQHKYVKSLEDNVVNSTPIDFQNTNKEIERETKPNLDSEQESKTVQTPAIEKQSEKVNEEFKINRETKQKAPVETQDPNILSEGFNKDKQEIEASKPETSNQPTETIETKISTPEPHIEFPSEGSKLKVELQISSPTHSEKGDKLNIEKPGIKNGSRGKETKIAISSIPRASIFDGQRACFQKEIEDGLGKLYQKQIDGISQKPGFGQAVSIVTFAGENKGASMVIGGEVKLREENLNSKYSTYPGINSSINSNVQSINNSTLQESSCSAHNPGVHLNLTSKQTEQPSQLGRIEPTKAKESYLSVNPDTKIPHDPRIRRRCLRALFLESESDPENPQKPQRHGCRFSCEEKRKKVNEDGIRLTNGGSKHAEEGSSRTFNQ
ncbi:pollen-specific leucine-rich repeat extensin-like protein 2 [Ananas comosus]|uniref:Pollen-specific leucine-rich repeat extensin-like protein 2 n=1 Tax=Ananas comosus TaxID=4615 RepID=A0A6P5GP88_ANACO|nr:pollen-specific leucine-rich repeat extensin-like protein 2 [Ananas comosus]